MAGPVRTSPIAGTWYPGDSASIVAEVEECLAGVGGAPPPGRLVALISPHAGLRYSGPVAAHAYALLRGRAGLTAGLLRPSHRMAFDGVAGGGPRGVRVAARPGRARRSDVGPLR